MEKKMDINKKLKLVIIKESPKSIDVDCIQNDTILTEELGFDSINIISLILAIEENFEIEIEDEDLDIENLTVYSNLYQMIKRKIEKTY